MIITTIIIKKPDNMNNNNCWWWRRPGGDLEESNVHGPYIRNFQVYKSYFFSRCCRNPTKFSKQKYISQVEILPQSLKAIKLLSGSVCLCKTLHAHAHSIEDMIHQLIS
jgi:hypothetical protein